MLDLADKHLKATIKNMFLIFKKLKFKELMENIVVTTQQKRNLNREIQSIEKEPNRNSRA